MATGPVLSRIEQCLAESPVRFPTLNSPEDLGPFFQDVDREGIVYADCYRTAGVGQDETLAAIGREIARLQDRLVAAPFFQGLEDVDKDILRDNVRRVFVGFQPEETVYLFKDPDSVDDPDSLLEGFESEAEAEAEPEEGPSLWIPAGFGLLGVISGGFGFARKGALFSWKAALLCGALGLLIGAVSTPCLPRAYPIESP